MSERTCSTCSTPARRIRLGRCDRCYQLARVAGLRQTGTAPRCTEAACDGFLLARGLCSRHYQRLVKYGRTTTLPAGPDRCTVDGCERKHSALGYCIGHRERLRKYGDVRADEPLKAPRGKGNGYVNTQGYFILPDGRKEHRVVMEAMIGRPLTRQENVHHKNTNRLDNRPENLELWISSQPSGGRVEDMVSHAVEILARYAPHRLAE